MCIRNEMLEISNKNILYQFINRIYETFFSSSFSSLIVDMNKNY